MPTARQLEQLTKDELYDLARDRHVEGRSSMGKGERGYEYEEGRYVTFTHEELEQIPSDSLHTIDVVQFVPEDQIDPIGFERSYYVAPDESGVKAYALFAEALRMSGKVGVAKVTLREKEQLCELWSRDGVLVLETMNWPDEIRVPAFEQLEKAPEVSDRELDGRKTDRATDRRL